MHRREFEGDVLSPDEPRDMFEAWRTTPIFLMRNSAGEFATIAREGTRETPKLPDGYHFAEIGRAVTAPASDTPAAPRKATARPTVSTLPQATANNPPLWTAAPEGYLFDAPPDLPDAPRFGVVDARTALLRWFQQGERYCTAHAACHGFTGEGHGLGYMLLPAKTQLGRAAPIATQHPGPQQGEPQPDRRAQPGVSPAPVAKPTETAPR